MATWPNSNATQGKFTNSSSGYKGSVGSPVHASTLQATDQEMGPSSHRHCRTSHLRHHSLPHNLTKLIARDKAVSTFWIVLANHPKREINMQLGCSKGKWFQASCSMLFIASRVDIACHTTSLFHSFSCRYSMSYDISISLLKKKFYKLIFSKSSREGGTHLFSKNHDGQSNMTIPFPRQYPTSTPNLHRATAVPSEYSVRHLSPFPSENIFWK
jgi:hypothetical protein